MIQDHRLLPENMPLFISEEEYSRCSDDPSLISQKADAFITQLQSDLKIKEDMLKCKDDKIKKLELKIEALQNELSSTKDMAAATEEQLSSANKLVELYKDSSDKWSKKAAELEGVIKEQIEKETCVTLLFEPEVILLVQNRAQFYGLPDEDPYAHIRSFLQVCSILETNGGSNDAIRLRLFPFSLRDRAESWFEYPAVCSVTTWDAMAEKFVSKYFPASKMAKLRNDITSFLQRDGESLYEAWERFKDLLRRCPRHDLPLWCQLQTFYYGLSDQTSREIVTWGTLASKTAQAAFDLIEEIAADSYYRQAIRNKPSIEGVGQVDANKLVAQIEALTCKIEEMQVSALQVSCEFCGAPHPRNNCPELFGSYGSYE